MRARLPGLLRHFRASQVLILAYAVFMGLLCYGGVAWNQSLYNTLHTLMRLLMVVVGGYGAWKIARLNGVVPRYVALGSAFILLGGVASMVATSLIPSNTQSISFLTAPLTYFMFGILAELICFTLILGYRQRRGAIRTAIVEQKLAREREQHQRE